MPDNTEDVLQDANAVAVGRTIHPEATGMLQVDRSLELFGTAQGSVGFRAPATAHGPIYTLPASDGTAGQVLTTDGASNLGWTTPSGGSTTGVVVSTIGATLGLAGSTLNVNERAFTWVPFDCTLSEVVLLATPSGTVTVGIWATSYANWPPTSANAITGSVPVTLASGVKYKDAALSTWTTTLASDMGIIFNVDAASTVEQVSCVLKIVKDSTTRVTTTIGGSLGLAGDTLSVNERVFTWVPFACTLTEVVLLATPAGTATVGIWATSYANYPPTSANAITGSVPVAISATGVKYKDAALTTWTTTIASDSVVMFNVDAISNVQQLTCVLKATVAGTSSGSSSSATDLGFGDGGVGLVHRGDSSGGRPYGGDYGGPMDCEP